MASLAPNESLTFVPAYESPDDAITSEQHLANLIAECYADPLKYVLTMFPWGVAGTPLAAFVGPDKWQRDFLNWLGDEVKARGFNGLDSVLPILSSMASGHGVGKTTMVAWLIKWIMDTRPFAKGVITANTKPQLKSKTWPELIKWNRLSLTESWWKVSTGEQLSMVHKNYTDWRLDGQTCEERNSEAFAGQHAAGSTSFYIFDEASAIPGKIFEVREGGLTDGESMAFDFGNPTRNSGRFYENMLGQYAEHYKQWFLDSREVRITNKAYLQRQIDIHGINSDYVKVRILGQFPSAGSLQFIPSNIVTHCQQMEAYNTHDDPVIIGVDVARKGEDASVICIRRGRNAKNPDHTGNIEAWQEFHKITTTALAEHVVNVATEIKADAVFIDGTGVGAGVVDRCRQLGLDVFEIHGSQSPNKPHEYANKRAECWGEMRDALTLGLALPEGRTEDDLGIKLKRDLVGIEYGYTLKNQIKLESKDEMAKRGLPSPDFADALALTFAMPYVAKRSSFDGEAGSHQSDFNPFDVADPYAPTYQSPPSSGTPWR